MYQRLADWWTNLFIPKWRIVDNGDKQMSSVEILSGEFAGMVYRYGSVAFPDDGNVLSWVYEIEDYDKPFDESRLRKVQGDILRQVLAKDLLNDSFLAG